MLIERLIVLAKKIGAKPKISIKILPITIIFALVIYCVLYYFELFFLKRQFIRFIIWFIFCILISAFINYKIYYNMRRKSVDFYNVK
jgi:hypothetical protein